MEEKEKVSLTWIGEDFNARTGEEGEGIEEEGVGGEEGEKVEGQRTEKLIRMGEYWWNL